MLLIKRSNLITITVISCLFIMILGVGYYNVIVFLNKTYNDVKLKYFAENFIYISIILTIILLFFVVYIIKRSRDFIKEINKVIEISKTSNLDPKEFLKRWGKFGEKINELTSNLTELNNLKTLKISSYWNLIKFLIDNNTLSMIMITPSGTINYSSKDFFDKDSASKNGTLVQRINDLISIELNDIILKLENTRTSITQKKIEFINESKTKKDIEFYPIFDANNNLSNILCIKLENDIVIQGKEAMIKLSEDVLDKKSDSSKMFDYIKKNISKLGLLGKKNK